jgi:hypothetical protein
VGFLMQFEQWKRRDFIRLVGGTTVSVVLPLPLKAQQAMPVVGILNSGGANPFGAMNKALVRGISEAGFVEGRNLKVEERFANGQYERLSELAAELTRIPVTVLAVPGGEPPRVDRRLQLLRRWFAETGPMRPCQVAGMQQLRAFLAVSVF